jgi:hypothetical protein
MTIPIEEDESMTQTLNPTEEAPMTDRAYHQWCDQHRKMHGPCPLFTQTELDELYRRNAAQPGTPKVVCAVKCGITGTEDCPPDYEGSENCPVC